MKAPTWEHNNLKIKSHLNQRRRFFQQKFQLSMDGISFLCTSSEWESISVGKYHISQRPQKGIVFVDNHGVRFRSLWSLSFLPRDRVVIVRKTRSYQFHYLVWRTFFDSNTRESSQWERMMDIWIWVSYSRTAPISSSYFSFTLLVMNSIRLWK